MACLEATLEDRLHVSIHMVRALVSAVEHAGASRESFLTLAGIEAELLGAHDTWLAVTEYRRALEAALEVTNDAALGLHLGEQASSAMFQLLAHLVEHAETLDEAVDRIVRYTGLVARDYEPRLITMDERAALRFPWLGHDDAAVRVMAELAMSGLVRLLRQYGADTCQLRVSFAYPRPARADEYRRVFRGRERFAQPFTELQFPRRWLACRQLHGNPGLSDLLKSQADRELALQRTDTTRARVEQVLLASDPRALPALPFVARALRVSARTLTRRLRNERISYAELLVSRRCEAARRLLKRPNMSIQEVADAMGFADAPAFHKAFKRWTGQTPRQYAAARAQ